MNDVMNNRYRVVASDRAPKPLFLTEPIELGSHVKAKRGNEHLWFELADFCEEDLSCEYSSCHYFARLLSTPADERLYRFFMRDDESNDWWCIVCLSEIEEVEQ